MLSVLTEAGYSNTRPRRTVLAALCEAGGQAAGAELLTIGRMHHPGLGLVTVYRTLEILLSLGLVRRLHREEGCHVYAISQTDRSAVGSGARGAAPAAPEHRHHIICQECGKAVEFAGCDLGVVVAAVEAQTGYRVRSHWLEMFGTCPRCQGGESANGRISE